MTRFPSREIKMPTTPSGVKGVSSLPSNGFDGRAFGSAGSASPNEHMLPVREPYTPCCSMPLGSVTLVCPDPVGNRSNPGVFGRIDTTYLPSGDKLSGRPSPSVWGQSR